MAERRGWSDASSSEKCQMSSFKQEMTTNRVSLSTPLQPSLLSGHGVLVLRNTALPVSGFGAFCHPGGPQEETAEPFGRPSSVCPPPGARTSAQTRPERYGGPPLLFVVFEARAAVKRVCDAGWKQKCVKLSVTSAASLLLLLLLAAVLLGYYCESCQPGGNQG